jgi:hypothetical protein
MSSASTSASQRGISITYNINVPSGVSQTKLQPNHSVHIPVGDLTSLSTALEEARNETNSTLTQWKEEIGELEKVREIECAKRAEERRMATKKAQGIADGESDEEEEEEDE